MSVVRFVGGPSDKHVVSFPGSPPASITFPATDGRRVVYRYNPTTATYELDD